MLERGVNRSGRQKDTHRLPHRTLSLRTHQPALPAVTESGGMHGRKGHFPCRSKDLEAVCSLGSQGRGGLNEDTSQSGPLKLGDGTGRTNDDGRAEKVSSQIAGQETLSSVPSAPARGAASGLVESAHCLPVHPKPPPLLRGPSQTSPPPGSHISFQTWPNSMLLCFRFLSLGLDCELLIG